MRRLRRDRPQGAPMRLFWVDFTGWVEGVRILPGSGDWLLITYLSVGDDVFIDGSPLGPRAPRTLRALRKGPIPLASGPRWLTPGCRPLVRIRFAGPTPPDLRFEPVPPSWPRRCLLSLERDLGRVRVWLWFALAALLLGWCGARLFEIFIAWLGAAPLRFAGVYGALLALAIPPAYLAARWLAEPIEAQVREGDGRMPRDTAERLEMAKKGDRDRVKEILPLEGDWVGERSEGEGG